MTRSQVCVIHCTFVSIKRHTLFICCSNCIIVPLLLCAEMKVLFVFDNSTNHDCLPENAIHRGTSVNKWLGGPMIPGLTVTEKITGKMIKVPKMRDVWWANKPDRARQCRKHKGVVATIFQDCGLIGTSNELRFKYSSSYFSGIGNLRYCMIIKMRRNLPDVMEQPYLRSSKKPKMSLTRVYGKKTRVHERGIIYVATLVGRMYKYGIDATQCGQSNDFFQQCR